jgi:hypothetical protein
MVLIVFTSNRLLANDIYITQSGNNFDLDVTQDGNNNSVSLNIQGNDNSLDVYQEGTAGNAVTFVSYWGTSIIQQDQIQTESVCIFGVVIIL